MSAPDLFLGGKVVLHRGDCLDVLKAMPDNSVDSCVTDPPYHLTSIVKRFGAADAAPCKEGKTGAYARASRGFMGKVWDGGDIAFRPELWAEVLRVLKPGAHLVAFSGTRTYHRMACAIEDVGFDVRDSLAYLYGVGFPKSHNMAGEWAGWGTALKPAMEPICLARKPLSEGTAVANVLRWGTGALNIDGCRIGSESITIKGGGGGEGTGWGLKHEINAPRVGRFPANVLHDGSDEVVGAFPARAGGNDKRVGITPERRDGGFVDTGAGKGETRPNGALYGDTGSAARFFYSAKADADDRLGSKHPTVKPVDLMRWLVRLVTPPAGTVLDPFAGTGTTGEAAWREGFAAVLIEREAEYQADIARRMALCLAGPDERARAAIKARYGDLPAGPMFAEIA